VIASHAMRAAALRLEAAGIDNAVGDARRLMAHAMGIEAERMLLHLSDTITEDAIGAFEAAILARLARQPVSQIIGWRAFWGRRFSVSPDVLDPRPDTETLVAEALSAPFTRVLDLGTGSGAILLSLLADRPAATGQGVDLSQAALGVAQRNASSLGVADRAVFCLSDWFSAVSGRFDLIVANPPYITEAEMPDLAREVREWEPHLALTPGGDGLASYRIIAKAAAKYLHPAGRLIVEIGPAQGAAVAAMFEMAGLQDVAILPDLDGRNRVVRAHI
jgi:release factor glutamine methyltransferase